LIAFESEEIITTQFLCDETGALLLAVHRVGRHERALGRQESPQQGLSAGISLLFSAIGIWSSVSRRWCVTAESNGRFGIVPPTAAQDLAVDRQRARAPTSCSASQVPTGATRLASSQLSTRWKVESLGG
jgi:hypothetical protein